ncbi:MAG: DEAD/DEAH box helicase [Spirochaetia bacterium]
MSIKTNFTFILDTSCDLPQLSVAAGRGKGKIPDYRSFSGAARRALQEFSLLVEKQARSFSWDIEMEDGECSLYDPGGRMIAIAASSGLLRNISGKTLIPQTNTASLMVSVTSAEDETFTLKVELLDSSGQEKTDARRTDDLTATGEPAGVSRSAKPHSTEEELKPVAPDYVLAGTRLFPCEDLGVHWKELDRISKRVGRKKLPLYLSMVLSRIPGLRINYPGFRTITTGPRTAIPGLLFQEIDAYGFLHILPVSTLPGYPPGFFEEQDIINVVEIDEPEKEILLSEVIYSITPVETFRNLIKKEGKTVRDQIMEEDGRFILSPECAGEFLSRNMQKLVTTFSLFQAEKLSQYKIRHLNPPIRLKLDHGIDFFEGTASVKIDQNSLSWSSFLTEYKKHGCISLPDNTRVYPSPASVERFQRLIRIVKRAGDDEEGRIEISFFDLMMFNLKEEIDAPLDLRKRIESFYLGFNSLDRKVGDYSLAESALRPYQVYGVQWMEHLCEHGIGGCLADEMGLGKTVQVISLLLRAFQDKLEAPTLIIAPRSLIWNWATELERFAPHLPVSIYYGPGRSKKDVDSGQKQIILTTYSITRIDIEELLPIEFSYLILDESQHIKNINAKRTKAILGLKAKNRIALSGTPVENNLTELYSLFRFLNPSFFGSKARFNREYGKPIQEEKDEQVLKELKKKIYPFMLRRLKQDVLKELPEKSEQTLLVDLDQEHLEIYHRRRFYLKGKIQEAIRRSGVFKASFIILQAMAELRRLAGIPEEDGEYPGRSAKREQLIEMIRDLRENGHKCLVFTNFLAAVDMISSDLERAGIANLIMTGATRNRQELVHRFQTDPEIGAFIMTLKTGGVGLNLTAADYVFIFDPWWNQAAESQAVDRTHRIGQQNPVFSYRIIARDTIEEKLLMLQQQKAELTSAILSSDTEAMKALSEEDLQFLLEG